MLYYIQTYSLGVVMLRKEIPIPLCRDELNDYLCDCWESGLFDEYSDDHFLIRAIENRLSSFNWDIQFIRNTVPTFYNLIDSNGKIDYSSFCENFCINLSQRLKYMECIFGKKQIEEFITGQFAAGKSKYSEDAFFQALSEVEILSFFHRGYDGWTEILYEPKIGINGDNPEACFRGQLRNLEEETLTRVVANIEVKTPRFSLYSKYDKPILIPGVLLTNDGRQALRTKCDEHGIDYINPRVTKLVSFLNSASEKFSIPKENEFNLLYINWSYSEFPENSFLEAWSLLTNAENGLLLHPEIATVLPFKESLNPDIYKKISAIIVYSSSIEELMFCEFRHVWQRNGKGCKFRMFVLDESLRNRELSNESNLLFQLTGMNPDQGQGYICFSTSEEKEGLRECGRIIYDNLLKS